jgi:hypothetical protein
MRLKIDVTDNLINFLKFRSNSTQREIFSGAEGIDSEKYFRERAWRPAPRQQEQEGLGNARGLDCHPALLLGEAATGLSRAATLHREEACRSKAQRLCQNLLVRHAVQRCSPITKDVPHLSVVKRIS